MKSGECVAHHDEQNLSRALIEVHVTPDGETFNLGSVKIGVCGINPEVVCWASMEKVS